MCRERAAKRPQDFGVDAKIAGAASRPFRDTRPLLQVPRSPIGQLTPISSSNCKLLLFKHPRPDKLARRFFAHAQDPRCPCSA
ncbi:hypothetical protein DMX06_12060 [Pseudomonas mosselii]|nr:hypothetical protein DMX06_12060 [Pseudomonas mosselii]